MLIAKWSLSIGLLLLLVSTSLADEENLLQAHYWNNMSGAVVRQDGKIQITGIDRKIRPKTEGKWYLNPPVNLTGPKLVVAQDFTVSFTVDTSAHPERNSFLDIYGTVPVHYDEWRIDGKHVRFGMKDGRVSVWVNMLKQTFVATAQTSSTEVAVARKSRELIFSVNGNEIGRAQDTVFTDGFVMFGADADLGSHFTIDAITASAVALGVKHNGSEFLKEYPPSPRALRNAARQLKYPLWIGTTIQANALLSDPEYAKTLASEFNMVTSEMDMKWQAIHPAPNMYAWAEADAILAFAEINGIRFRGHALVWHEALPTWVWDIYHSGNKVQLRAALIDHVTSVVTRYKGRVKEWDVLNEIFSDEYEKTNEFGMRDDGDSENNPSIWFKEFGPQIFIDVIKVVREVDPNCEIWINEYGIEQLGMRYKLENMARFINYAASQGASIDGVGFQSHNYDPDGDPSIAEEMLESFQFIHAQTGVKVRVSELDVSEASSNPKLFSDKLETCITFNTVTRGQCTSFGLWGFTDKYGSMSAPKNTESEGTNFDSANWGVWQSDSLIFDSQMLPREAYRRLRRTLEQVAD